MEELIKCAIGLVAACVATLVLTPSVRGINTRLGMVDKPDPRRINKVPVTRGGGWAILLGVQLAVALVGVLFGFDKGFFVQSSFWRLTALSVAMCMIGLVDDKFSLPPRVKLAGQLAVALLAWFWAGLGFRSVFDWMPAWLDLIVTTFWIVGAVNAFNLIDGLDGLASGLAFIAMIGMGGSLFFLGETTGICYYMIVAGALLGFLRYNYHPASIFLGDCGSMYLGFVISTLPMCTHHASGSFLVSVGVPLLAMGVPIFDTALAIVRRSIRHLILRKDDAGAGQVMTADSDHLHHRILRSVGLSQRKTAWILYSMAIVMVVVGLVGMSLQSRAGGLWLLAVAVATVVVFKDIYRVELFDAGRLLNRVAHDRKVKSRRKWAQLTVPFYVSYDLVVLAVLSLVFCWLWDIHVDKVSVKTVMPIRVISVFLVLVAFKVYRTVWSRAMLSNYLRLFAGCFLGSMLGGSVIYYAVPSLRADVVPLTCAYAVWSCFLLFLVRAMRGIVRDLFYAIDCSRLVGRKDVQRILVYGAGLRYRAFRRELVRTASDNNRIIVGIIDDDILIKGKYIGGIQIKGPLIEAPEIINATNADSVVIACEIDDTWLKVVRDTLKPTGVKLTYFTFNEKEV